MFKSFSVILFVFSIVCTRSIDSLRKILDGKAVTDKGYMVYLLKAPMDKAKYDSWICGGAIVTELFIITSAACIKDVTYMYAIAGYSNYFKVDQIDQDDCMKTIKKKIVEICVPETYELIYEKLEVWSNIDIGLVKVESPYVFNETPAGCSWGIRKIEISFDTKYQEPSTDAVVFGWGHNLRWRDKDDRTDMNQQTLQSSSILIRPKEECIKAYVAYNPNMETIIQKYMICADGEGNIDGSGKVRTMGTSLNEGCPPNMLRVGNRCIDPKKWAPVDKQVRFLRTGTQVNDIAEETKLDADQKNKSNATSDETTSISKKGDSVTKHSPNVNTSTTKLMQDQKNGSHTTSDETTSSKGDYVTKYSPSVNIGIIKLNSDQNNESNTTSDGTTSSNNKGDNVTKHSPNLNIITQELNQSFSDNIGSEIFKDKEHDRESHSLFLQDLVIADRLKKYQNASEHLNLTRRNGICQNDHGGPLVRWIGSEEFLIGVSSVFRINEKFECTGPFLFTSTACNSAFLHCVLDDADSPTVDRTRRDICKLSPQERGFDIKTRRISWANHPDGPAANEIVAKQDLFLRPQRPLHEFHGRPLK